MAASTGEWVAISTWTPSCRNVGARFADHFADGQCAERGHTGRLGAPTDRMVRWRWAGVGRRGRPCNASTCNAEVTGWLRHKRLDESRFLPRHLQFRTRLLALQLVPVVEPQATIPPAPGEQDQVGGELFGSVDLDGALDLLAPGVEEVGEPGGVDRRHAVSQ